MQMPDTYEIIGKEGCSFCVLAKNLLDTKGLAYEYKSLGENIDIAELKRRVPGVRSVPVVFVNGVHIGGYRELERKVNGT
jgi:glutaredoxin 3